MIDPEPGATAAQRIEQLKARIAELEAEVASLRATPVVIYASPGFGGTYPARAHGEPPAN